MRLLTRELRVLLVLALSAGAEACSAARMQVPAEIAEHSELLVATERSAWTGAFVNEEFKLGPYAVRHVNRKWDLNSGMVIGSVSQSNSKGGYAYDFAGANANESGHCASADKDTSMTFKSGLRLEFQFAKLACACDAEGKRATVEVESAGDAYAGSLTTSAGSYRLASVHEWEGGTHSSEPVGYRVDGDGGVGAAEVVHPGRVWLDRALDAEEREQIACLFVGLMLYVPKDKL